MLQAAEAERWADSSPIDAMEAERETNDTEKINKAKQIAASLGREARCDPSPYAHGLLVVLLQI